MKYNRLTRRLVLQGIGQSLALPLLPSLMPSEARAQASAPIRRFISVVGNYDIGRHQNLYPRLEQPQQILNPGNGDRVVRYAPLADYLTGSTANLSTILGNSLNPHLDSINLVRGLDMATRYGHGRGQSLGNPAATDGHDPQYAALPPLPTVDQFLNSVTRFNPDRRDVTVMGGTRNLSYRRSGTNIVEASLTGYTPREVFNYLFNNGALPESTGTGSVPPHPRRDLLSAVLEDYNRVRTGRQISSQDRSTLDNIFDKLSDVLRGLSAGSPGSGSCRYRNITLADDGVHWFRSTKMKTYADIIVAAIMCDVTRVITFQGDFWDDLYYPDFHQSISHRPWDMTGGRPNWQIMGEIHGELVRNFVSHVISGLAGATDPSNGRSYLYNSLIFQTAETSQTHGFNTMPCILAGNAGGNLSTGHYLDYTDRTSVNPLPSDNFERNDQNGRFSHEYTGVPYNRLFNTILQSMGVTAAEYENSSINSGFQNVSNGRFGALNNGIANMGGFGHWGSTAYPQGDWWGDQVIARYALYNLHHYKNVLPMPPSRVS